MDSATFTRGCLKKFLDYADYTKYNTDAFMVALYGASSAVSEMTGEPTQIELVDERPGVYTFMLRNGALHVVNIRNYEIVGFVSRIKWAISKFCQM